MYALSILSYAIAVAASIPFLVVSLECLAAVLSFSSLQKSSRSKQGSQTEPLRERPLAVLVPAHNEEEGLEDTIKDIQSQLQPGDQLLVVADNCTDSTADVARAANATTIERSNASERGKGYAIDFGLRSLEIDSYAAVILLDADCRLEPKALDHLYSEAIEHSRPIQAKYLMTPDPEAGPGQNVSQFAICIKNHVRLKGLKALGMPCLITGSGIALPSELAKRLVEEKQLATGNIVEDMQLSYDFMFAGSPPLFSEEAEVTAVLPPNRTGESIQRTRWEHGHMQTLMSQGPRLMLAALRGKPSMMVMALDLMVPPLSLSVIVWMFAVALTVLLSLSQGDYFPTAILLSTGCLFSFSLFLAWARFCRDQVNAITLAATPLYMLGKIPIYLRFALQRYQKEWVRTSRS